MQADENNRDQEKEPLQEAQPELTAEPTPEEKITALEAALEEAKASVLYVKAEGENIRRRAMDDIDKARKFALEKFSNELLAVKDSLDAALKVGNADVESYKNGVELTARQKPWICQQAPQDNAVAIWGRIYSYTGRVLQNYKIHAQT